MHPKRLLWLILLIVIVMGWTQTEEELGNQYVISIGSKTMIPIAGERILPLGIERHLIVQFYQIPDAESRQKLARQGVNVVGYIDGNAYIVSVKPEGDQALAEIPGIRAVLAFNPDMKLSPLLKDDLVKIEEDGKMAVTVVFHRDVPFESALKEIERAGLYCQQTDYLYFHIIKLEVNPFGLRHLLQTDEVEWIDPSLTPPREDNAWAAKRSVVDNVWNKTAYKRPKGNRERVGVWDGGKVFKHKSLKPRVILGETSGDLSEHATHVAGTIASTGKGKKAARGMATAAKIYSYNFHGDPVDEMWEAVNKYKIRISNNSWGNVVGWDYNTENNRWEWWGGEFFGYYHSDVKSQDHLVRETDLFIVRSAGNDRDDGYLGPYLDMSSDTEKERLQKSDPDYGSVTPHACGKNVITVGALMKDDVVAGFSNWGPTDNGRIKPDVVATGKDIQSSILKNKYGTMSGTSMAAPVVSGAAALLRQVYGKYIGGDISSDMLKCLLIHTARDLGPAGPDYSYGFGLIDAKYAADLIKAKSGMVGDGEISHPADLLSQMIKGRVGAAKSQGQESYTISVQPGATELRATLVWHDPEKKILVNNLDLWLKSPTGSRVNPFVLDPKKPANPAKKGINNKDNVEHILVKNPVPGKWTVFVKGKKVPMGPQIYALIYSSGDGNSVLLSKDSGQMSIHKVYAHNNGEFNLNSQQNYARGEYIYFKIAIFLPENADWGSFNGTVSFQWKVLRKGKTIFKSNDSSSSFYELPDNQYWMYCKGPFIIPSDMAKGDYVLKVRATLHNGITKMKSFTFKVV